MSLLIWSAFDSDIGFLRQPVLTEKSFGLLTGLVGLTTLIVMFHGLSPSFCHSNRAGIYCQTLQKTLPQTRNLTQGLTIPGLLNASEPWVSRRP